MNPFFPKQVPSGSAFFIALLLAFVEIPNTWAQGQKMDPFIKDLMNKMTLDEKIGQLNLLTAGSVKTGLAGSTDAENKIRSGKVGGVFGVWNIQDIRSIQEMAVKKSRLHIPILFGLDVIHGHKTIFPIPLALSCSWDTSLVEWSARIAAIEASAEGINWVFSPMVDISRDPRWGRIAEGSGEDPFLGSLMAKAMVRGYQGKSLNLENSVMACVKHFALYGGAEAGREYNTVDMSRIRMYQDYLPPYKAAVEAGAGSFMSSFNTVDGIPASANKWLLTDLLRNQWGFKGFVVSDYTAVNEMTDHGLGDLAEVSAKALKAGLDMDMVGEGFLSTLKKSLKNGLVSQADIDRACKRILEAKYKLGLFANPFKNCDSIRAAHEILTPDHLNSAREIARHTMVLLKNRNQALPLKPEGKIALIGPLAKDSHDMLGTWAIAGQAFNPISIFDGFNSMVGGKAEILYAKGANITDDSTLASNSNFFGQKIIVPDSRSPKEMIQEAVDLANQSDQIVLVLGEAESMTGESSSRSDIRLPSNQIDLLKALSATGKKIILILINGRPLDLSEVEPKVEAILEAWAPGSEAGPAIADLIFNQYNPSGKLSVTFPRSVGQIPIYYNHKNTGRPYSGQGPRKFKSDYLDISNDPLYPFGYGLSYTQFTYSPIRFSKTRLKGNEVLEARVTLTNTGKYTGEETAQLYIGQASASISRSVKELKGLKKLVLEPGKSREISFKITPQLLKFYNAQLEYNWEPGIFIIGIGTNSEELSTGKINWVK
jgi:beta-glucosidase